MPPRSRICRGADREQGFVAEAYARRSSRQYRQRPLPLCPRSVPERAVASRRPRARWRERIGAGIVGRDGEQAGTVASELALRARGRTRRRARASSPRRAERESGVCTAKACLLSAACGLEALPKSAQRDQYELSLLVIQASAPRRPRATRLGYRAVRAGTDTL
jgi:hypothetical protein